MRITDPFKVKQVTCSTIKVSDLRLVIHWQVSQLFTWMTGVKMTQWAVNGRKTPKLGSLHEMFHVMMRAESTVVSFVLGSFDGSISVLFCLCSSSQKLHSCLSSFMSDPCEWIQIVRLPTICQHSANTLSLKSGSVVGVKSTWLTLYSLLS